tara:strand:- start:2992 stop:3585 length:594 start_codon:yes stop_codon:yes gene_type:complete
MFTGIIEDVGIISNLETEDTNLHITVSSKLTPELKIDQSVAHNGVCLTVVSKNKDQYTVTAIKETLEISTLNSLRINSKINLERCLQYGGRIDGHIVQGHVDQKGKVDNIKNENGSWLFTISLDPKSSHLIVNKGSITVNGVSLTVVNPTQNTFSIAVIPYTFEHTMFSELRVNDYVNLEFDILGKYIGSYMEKINP